MKKGTVKACVTIIVICLLYLEGTLMLHLKSIRFGTGQLLQLQVRCRMANFGASQSMLCNLPAERERTREMKVLEIVFLAAIPNPQKALAQVCVMGPTLPGSIIMDWGSHIYQGPSKGSKDFLTLGQGGLGPGTPPPKIRYRGLVPTPPPEREISGCKQRSPPPRI